MDLEDSQKRVTRLVPEQSQSGIVPSGTTSETPERWRSEQPAMFRITRETCRVFTVGEVLIMAAANVKMSAFRVA
jgi:hypothetical protein